MGFKADCERTYDERKPIEPSYPSITPSIADFVVKRDGKGDLVVNGVNGTSGGGGDTSEEEELQFAPPGLVPSFRVYFRLSFGSHAD